jgi:ATP synthase protein I
MTEPKSPKDEVPAPLSDLEARLRLARERAQRGEGGARGEPEARLTGFGLAFRVGVELVSALLVGVGLGWLVDKWLGTKPWGLVVFFFLGAAAGILNVYRTVAAMGQAPSAAPPEGPPEGEA